MAWTYSGDPAASPRDAVRFLIGDTLTADQQLQDAEIAFHVDRHSSIELAAAACADALEARYARKVDVTDGDTRLAFSQRAMSYGRLAATLRTQAREGAAPIPYAGGTSISEACTRASDPDRFPDSFAVGMHDYH